MKEREIQKAILQYLVARRVLAFRMQTGAHVSQYKGKSRLIRYGTPGMADILAFVPGKLALRTAEGTVPVLSVSTLWIECKAPKGKQTPDQQAFQKIVEDNGHRYIVARSIDDVEKAL